MTQAMIEIDRKVIKNFLSTAHRIAKLKLVMCSSGNLSMRIDKDIMIISATGSWLERLKEEDISICRINDGEVLNNIKPSVEFRFHTGIYKVRPDIKTVLHFQSPYSTIAACTESFPKDFNVIPEIPYYIGKIERIPFYLPGSKELAEAVTEKAKSSNIIIMQNHGIVTMADSIDLLIKRAVFFELACKIIFIGGDKIKSIPNEKIKKMEI